MEDVEKAIKIVESLNILQYAIDPEIDVIIRHAGGKQEVIKII